MNETARIYLDESKLFDYDVNEGKPEPEIPIVNHEAVKWYETYFQKMMENYTFQLHLNNGDVYYVFSTVNTKEWTKAVKSRLVVQATRYLDKVYMEEITIHSILSIRNVTELVRNQYEKQREMIFNSYALVNQIMEYKESSFVQEMIDYILKSREDDESKRKFWRIVNEQYYGLDIHPLMEYEELELQKILYYCKHPEERAILKWRPIVRAGAMTAGAVVAGWITYITLIR